MSIQIQIQIKIQNDAAFNPYATSFPCKWYNDYCIQIHIHIQIQIRTQTYIQLQRHIEIELSKFHPLITHLNTKCNFCPTA